jgi:TonB family protein
MEKVGRHTFLSTSFISELQYKRTAKFLMAPQIRPCRIVLSVISVFLTLAIPFSVYGQEVERAASHLRDRGIELYRQGKMLGAIEVLNKVVEKNSNDADAWYYLGLAYSSEGSFLWARPAFERLLVLRNRESEANARLSYILILANEQKQAIAAAHRALALGNPTAEPHFTIAESNLRMGEFTKAIEEAEIALKIRPDFAEALITKSLAHYSLKQYAESAAAIEKFLAINPGDPDAEVWRAQSRGLRRWSEDPAESSVREVDSDTPLRSSEVTVRARVLHKNEPAYTDAARNAGVVGTVFLRCVFSSTGEVKNLVVIKALGYGLTGKAVQAARGIRFTPATKDGRPVSMWMQLEYNFHLY